MKVCGIYTITNIVNGKMYVGQSVDIFGRWIDHKSELRKDNHVNSYLQKTWNKYGEEKFLFEVLEECEEQFLYTIEHYWATILNVHNPKYGYNIMPTHPYGNPRHTEETRKKISRGNKGKIKNIGSKRTENTKQKMRSTKSQKSGKPIVILDIKGRYIKEEKSLGDVAEYLGYNRKSIGNIQAVLKGRNGQKSIKNHILVYKEKYNPDKKYGTDYNKRIVLQYDLNNLLINQYESIAQAARSVGVSTDAFAHAIKNNKNNMYRGYTWKKKEREIYEKQQATGRC